MRLYARYVTGLFILAVMILFFVSCSSIDRIRIDEGMIVVGECTFGTAGCILNECGDLIGECAKLQTKCIGLGICLLSNCLEEVESCADSLQEIVNKSN